MVIPIYIPTNGAGGFTACGHFDDGHSDWCEVIQFSSVTESCPILYDPRDCSTPGFPKLMSIKLVKPSNHLILCCPLPLLPSIFPSIRVFSNESVILIRWPKYWSFSFMISPSKEYLGLVPFRIDWLDLLAVQGTLKSLLQHESSKASILWCSVFFIVSHIHYSFDCTFLIISYVDHFFHVLSGHLYVS